MFLTNKLPSVRHKLKIDLDDIRAHNPAIIYVRGHGQGDKGPDADRGSYDSLAFWCRAGVALGSSPPDPEHVAHPPAPAFGDSIGAMTIAGGIMGALFHRERTGETTEVDVSLLGVGLWSMGAALALSLQMDVPWRGMVPGTATGNPLTGNYRTKDGRFVALTCLQMGKYWPEACEVLGVPDLATDERFEDHASLAAHAAEATELLRARFLERTAEEWRERAPAVLRPVGDGAGHARGRGRPADRRQRLRPGVHRRGGLAVPARIPARALRRRAARPAASAGVQRARRRDPRGSRHRLGPHRRPEGPRRRHLTRRGSPDPRGPVRR